MSRYIDADALYKRLKNKTQLSLREPPFVEWEDIEAMPTIEIPTWIPCAERLPESIHDDVLMITKDREIYAGFLNGVWIYLSKYGELCGMQVEEVTHWIPLSAIPMPYREGE